MITLMVNGEKRTVDVPPDTRLLWVLRDTLGLRGTNYDCCSGSCGTCTVYIDGLTAQSCVVPVSFVGERNVITVEGLRVFHESSEEEEIEEE